jgi:hypothetical protein
LEFGTQEIKLVFVLRFKAFMAANAFHSVLDDGGRHSSETLENNSILIGLMAREEFPAYFI